MKKNLLALSLALIMLFSVFPATVLTVAAEEDNPYLDLSMTEIYNSNGDGEFKISDKYTATLEQTLPHGNENKQDAVYIAKVFGEESSPFEVAHLTQTIKIDNMPIVSKPNFHGNYYKTSGFFNTLERNRTSGVDGTFRADYITYSIFRKDAAGNLGMKIFNPLNQALYSQDVPLNKKLGEEFKLSTVWHADNKVTFYCDGQDLGTYDGVTFNHKAYYNINCLMFGYFNAFADEEGYDGNIKLSVGNIIATDGHVTGGDCTKEDLVCTSCGTFMASKQNGHTAMEDDGDCTTDILCSTPGCLQVVTPGKDSHARAADFDCTKDQFCTDCGTLISEGANSHKKSISGVKNATATEKGYTGDVVCYVCGELIEKGEDIPALGGASANQGNDVVIYIVIAAAVVVLAVAAVVVVIVVKKRKNK